VSKKVKARATKHGKDSVPLSKEMVAQLEELRKQFIEHFGREPRPDDPLFFDPDYHIPVPISPEKLVVALAEASLKAGITHTEEEQCNSVLISLKGAFG